MITREQLYELVWTTSLRSAAELLGVSDVFLARVCRRMDVPHPPRGYHRLRELGRAPDRPPLPEWQPGTERAWSKGRAARHTPPARVRPPANPDPQVRRVREGVHPLVAEAAIHLAVAGTVPGSAYLVPRKKLMADLTATSGCRAKCLRFASALFNALGSAGHGVAVAPAEEGLVRIAIGCKRDHGTRRLQDCPPWRPMRPTVAYVFGVPVGIAVIELSERVVMRYVGGGRTILKRDYRPAEHVGPTWDAAEDRPTGRLKLVAYSPFHGIPWLEQWVEEPGQPLDRRLDAVVAGLRSGAIDLAEKLEAAGRYFA